MNLFTLIKSAYVEQPVADETLWHRRLRAPWRSRTIDGVLIGFGGQIWRRKRDGKWEYREDEESLDEYADRQW